MVEYVINLTWDDEASVWIAVNDDIPITLVNGSLDALMVQVKYIVPEMLIENGLMDESKSVLLKFCAERTDKLVDIMMLSGEDVYWHENHAMCPAEGENDMSDYIFKRYKDYRDKCDSLTKELNALREIEAKHIEAGMTDFQYKSIIEMIYQIVKANFEAGKSHEEILSIFAALKNEQREANPHSTNA